eukprot:363864-Chlamydomonas_euryale.AAC.8
MDVAAYRMCGATRGPAGQNTPNAAQASKHARASTARHTTKLWAWSHTEAYGRMRCRWPKHCNNVSERPRKQFRKRYSNTAYTAPSGLQIAKYCDLCLAQACMESQESPGPSAGPTDASGSEDHAADTSRDEGDAGQRVLVAARLSRAGTHAEARAC